MSICKRCGWATSTRQHVVECEQSRTDVPRETSRDVHHNETTWERIMRRYVYERGIEVQR